MEVLGHRGGRGEGWPPENTLEAFARAFAEGAAGIELDVRLCASGEPILLHDPSLEGISDGADRRLVHQVRRSDLPHLAGGARIALLDDALALARERDAIVNVEIKGDGPGRLALVRAALRSIARGGASAVERIVVSSFYPEVVLAVGAIGPRIPRAILVGPRTPYLAAALPLALRRGIVAAHVEDGLLSAERIARLKKSGLRVVVWTVNSPERARVLAGLGVDWTITDCPAAILAGLQSPRD